MNIADVADDEAGVLEGPDSLILGQTGHIGHQGRGHWPGHRQLDGRALLDRFAGCRILRDDGARLGLVGLDGVDAHDQAVVSGRSLGVLQPHVDEVRRTDGGDR